MAELSTRYNPAEIETKWYRYWEEKGYFTPKGVGEKFSIVIPPPNITGRIHMGHALNITLQDIVVRYKRMKGTTFCGFQVKTMPELPHRTLWRNSFFKRRVKPERR